MFNLNVKLTERIFKDTNWLQQLTSQADFRIWLLITFSCRKSTLLEKYHTRCKILCT